jgi:PKD repeat protein
LGFYRIAFTVSDGTPFGVATAVTALVVGNTNRAPTLNPIPNTTLADGAVVDQGISGSDPDGDALTFSKVAGPFFMTVATTGPTTGNIHLAPPVSSPSGSFGATVRADDGHFGSADQSFTITVLNGPNRCPVARPGGPYSGAGSTPIVFHGEDSSDPDGDPLTYAWDFDSSNGIQVDAVGSSVSHGYPSAGTYTVTLTVTDNGGGDPAQICSNSATTTADVSASCPANVFSTSTIRLGSGKPLWYAYVEPSSHCYSNADVVIPSFIMKYGGRQIPAADSKVTIGSDKNGDSVEEISIAFSKSDLRTLFAGLPSGHSSVSVTIEADLLTGGRLSGSTTVNVVSNGSFSMATVSPNPLNPEATLTYITTRQGAVRVDLFNIQGRLVRRLVDESALAAGTHDVTINGQGMHGEKLPSGVYYVRGTSPEGEFKQLITILK